MKKDSHIEQAPSLSQRSFGRLSDGREITAWTLKGAGGMEMEILSYGAAISRLIVPDWKGSLADVVLGHTAMDGWEHANPSFFGVVAGRIAGRVPKGRLIFEEQEFQLLCNDRGNHLHGGEHGLDKRIWESQPLKLEDGTVGLQMQYQSPNGEEGYPGTVNLVVRYLLTPGNAMVFETEAQADQVTPITIAQHSYFNLAGADSGSAKNHTVQIFSDQVMKTDEKMTPLGLAEGVEGRAEDLRETRVLGDVITDFWQQHGGCYPLPGGEALKPAARLTDPESGRVMDVSTTHDFMQFYTGAHLDGSLGGKGGVRYPKYGGLCFECQGYSDPSAGFGDILVRPGQTQCHHTVYAFSQAGDEA